MDFIQLLIIAQNSETFAKNRVYALTCKEYPALFATRLLNLVRTHSPVHTLALEDIEINSAAAQLATSFLGQTAVYWLGFSGVLDTKKKQWLTQLLKTYEGPHQLIVICEDQPKSIANGVVVSIPEYVDQTTYTKMTPFFAAGKSYTLPTNLPGKLTLDAACLLLSYQQLLGSRPQPAFSDTWLPRIMNVEQSLFALAQAFFAKQPQQFFDRWATIAHEYPEPFWVSYWADQLWRAYWFITYQKKQEIVEAKKMGARLPFSFLQKDWKRHSPTALKAAHNTLYEIDYKVKNGGGPIAFDLFFAGYFQKG